MERELRYIAIFILMVIGVSVNAQTTIQGKLLDLSTNRPIPYANVWLEGTQEGTASDYDGEFIFNSEELADSTLLIIKSVGYHTLRIKASLFVNSNKTVYVKPQVFDIEEVTTVSKKLMNDLDEIVKAGINQLQEISKKKYTLYGTFHNIFQGFEKFEVKNHSQNTVDIKVNPSHEMPNSDKISIIEKKNEDDFWSSFRYNQDAVLPQYEIPDYGTNHLQFLLNMNPVRYPKQSTFDFVNSLNRTFTKNHWFALDSIRPVNGRLTYFINVFVKPHIQYTYINLVPHYYLNGRSFKSFQQNKDSDQVAQLSVGKFWVDVNDLAIVYFEYYNGFMNDRYKFCAEYNKMEDGAYYPTKLYFANKFWMKENPSFNKASKYMGNSFYCQPASTYAKDLFSENQNTAEGRFLVNNIVNQNTIYELSEYCRHPSYSYSIAYTKATEDIQKNLLLKDYDKYFHHRLLRIDSIKVNKNVTFQCSSYTDFDKNIYYLGDPAQHEFLYNSGVSKTKWVDKDNLKRSNMVILLDHKLNQEKTKELTLIPVTSVDEHLYHRPKNDNTQLFDKEHLIKGYVKCYEISEGESQKVD